MADEQGPWSKYQAAPAEAGPWTKYAQPEKEAAPKPAPGPATSIGPQASMWDTIKSSAKRVALDPFNLPGELGRVTSPIENYTQEGRAQHPILSRLGDATKAGKDYASLVGDTLSLTGGEGLAGETAASALARTGSKTEPLAKINKILGVTNKELIPGKTPSSLADFVANPARGVTKAGLTEAKLTKMSPIERNAAVMAARDSAGKSLEKVLEQATQAGKQVNVQQAVNKVFGAIPDEKLLQQAEARVLQIMDKAGIAKPLSQLTPTEARALQRGLDDFANFSDQNMAKSFKDIATQLRRGISEATRKVVPESAEFDRDYSDLANASKATQKQMKQFARTAPQNKLRDMIIKAAVGGGLGGGAAMYGLEKMFGGKSSSSPLP